MEHTAGDRRYVCTACATKWYVPASRPEAPEPDRCGACGAPLQPLSASSAGAR